VCQGGVLGDRLASTITLRLGFRIVVGFGTDDRREGYVVVQRGHRLARPRVADGLEGAMR
jgi:hypothetical protein